MRKVFDIGNDGGNPAAAFDFDVGNDAIGGLGSPVRPAWAWTCGV